MKLFNLLFLVLFASFMYSCVASEESSTATDEETADISNENQEAAPSSHVKTSMEMYNPTIEESSEH